MLSFLDAAAERSQDTEDTAAVTAPEEVASVISPAELAAQLRSDSDILVMDVRPSSHHYRMHIRGAFAACATPRVLRAADGAEALAMIESDTDLDASARLALQRMALCNLVVVYDSGGPVGQGPAHTLGNLLATGGYAAEVAVLEGGFSAFASQHAGLCVRPPPSAGHCTVRGSLDLTPKGLDGAMAATRCLVLDGSCFELWIGGARDAANRDFLAANHATHVLNCTKELPNRHASDAELGLHYLKLGLLDECKADIGSQLDRCVAFLDEARVCAQQQRRRCSVLVHCYMGRSRSVAVAIAYMVAVLGCDVRVALQKIREYRPDARPNDGFMRQLEAWAVARRGQATRAAALPIVCIMRHSKRLDAHGHEGISPEQWPDRLIRPYDPPISDYELAQAAAAQLRAHGLGVFDVIACSPYRRTLQTAGIVARALGIRQIVLDNRLGEWLDMADRCWKDADVPKGLYSYMSDAEAAEWASSGASADELELMWQRDAHAVLAHPDDLKERVRQLPHICAAAVQTVRAKQPSTASTSSTSLAVLVVTHGDFINLFAPGFDWDPSVGRYRADECGWVACRDFEPLPTYEGDTKPLSEVPRVIASSGVEPL